MRSEAVTRAPARGFQRAPVRIFFLLTRVFVRGGSSGVESMFSWPGPGSTLVMQLELPAIRSLPTALISGGLGPTLPGERGFAAWARGPVLYSFLRAIYGGPGSPSSEAGDDAVATEEDGTVEDAS